MLSMRINKLYPDIMPEWFRRHIAAFLLTERKNSGSILVGGVPMDQIETLRKWIEESHNIVAFTGAGVSTET